MQDDEDGPKDWELKDEEPPESLRRKWDRDGAPDRGTVICPACNKETPAGNLTCIYCASPISQGNCPIGCFLSWIKRLLKRF